MIVLENTSTLQNTILRLHIYFRHILELIIAENITLVAFIIQISTTELLSNTASQNSQ